MRYKIVKTDKRILTVNFVLSVALYIFAFAMLVFSIVGGIILFIYAHKVKSDGSLYSAAGTFLVGATGAIIQFLIIFRNNNASKKERIKFTIEFFEKNQHLFKLADELAHLYEDMNACFRFNIITPDRNIILTEFTIKIIDHGIINFPFTKLSKMVSYMIDLLNKMNMLLVNIENCSLGALFDEEMYKKIIEPYKLRLKIMKKIMEIYKQ